MLSKKLPFILIPLLIAVYSFSQSQNDKLAKRIADFKRLSGYSEFAGKSLSAQMRAYQGSLSLSVDLKTLPALNGFYLKNQRDFFHYNRGIERSVYFKQGERSNVSIRFFVGSNDASDAREWIVSEAAVSSSLPVDALASSFALKEGIAGDFSMGTIDKYGKRLHAFVFCRQNIGVFLRTSDAALDLLPLAKQIDAALTQSPVSAFKAGANPTDAIFEAKIPDTIPAKTAFMLPFNLKKGANSAIEMNVVGSNGNIRCGKTHADSILIISQSDEGTGDVGIVLYDTATLASRWITHAIVTKKK